MSVELPSVKTQVHRIWEALPDDAEKFDAHRVEAQRLAKRAAEVLHADYSGNFDRP